MATRFMTRIFSAQDKQEDEILDQIQNDVEIAMEDGKLDTEEYSISKFSDDSVVITDKGNGEQTKATVSEGKIDLEEMPEEYPEESSEEHSEPEAEVKTECDRKFSDKTQKYIDKLKKKSSVRRFSGSLWWDNITPDMVVISGVRSVFNDEVKISIRHHQISNLPKVEYEQRTGTEGEELAHRGFSWRDAHEKEFFNKYGKQDSMGIWKFVRPDEIEKTESEMRTELQRSSGPGPRND